MAPALDQPRRLGLRLGAARALELWRRLGEHVAGAPVQLLRGENVIEGRPRGVNKGRVVDRVLGVTPGPLPTIVAIVTIGRRRIRFEPYHPRRSPLASDSAFERHSTAWRAVSARTA